MSVIPQWVENDDPRPQLVIPAHDKPISNVAYLPDGQRVVTGSDDGTVRVWNLEYGEEEGMPLEHENTISSLAVTRDGTKIISSDVNGKIKVWDVKSCELVKQWSHPETSPTIAISPDDRLIAVGEETVVIYTVKGRRVHHSISVGGFVLSKCFSTDGSRLACGTDEDIRVYDVKRGILILGPLRGHEHSVNSVLWSHDGSRLFSASKDKTIRCWNPDTGKPIGQPLTGHERDICSLSLSSDGSILASASSDKTVRFWDVNSARPIGQHLQHDDKVIATCFSPSGKSVVSAGGKGSIYLWPVPQLDSIGTRTTLADLRTRVSISDFSPPPYSTHIPASGKVSDLDLGIFLPDAEPISAPPHPITPLILPPLFSTSLMVKQQDKKTTTISIPPPPPDLTSYLAKAEDHYVAGGGFGDVYKSRYLDGSKEVAVKAFRFTFAIDGDASDRSTRMLRRELGIWRRLDHNNIVPFLGFAYGFGMRGAMALVSLWMPNESLHLFLAKYDDNLGLKHRLQLLLDIATGLHYLHSFPIVHGDLNCHNVLLDADYTARLADFGYASLVGNIPEALTYLQRSTARPGALRWMAPEQVESEEPFNRTPKSDIYSFGCIALQVLSGKQPWSEVRGESAVILRLAKGHKPGRPESRAIDDWHWNFIQDCWSPIEERPATKVIISTIQRFLSHCLPSPPLRDWLASESTHADSLVDALSSSLSKATMGYSRGKRNVLNRENQKRRVL